MSPWPSVDSDVAWPNGILFFLAVAPIEPEDKGSTRTDGALGRTEAPVPNRIEEWKLATARAAVESAGRAGTLYGVRCPMESHAAMPSWADADSAAGKGEGAAPGPPAVLRPDAAACVGVLAPPLQLDGPAGFSPAEKAKAARQDSLPDANAGAHGRKDGTR
jgi:hypothetical protein